MLLSRTIKKLARVSDDDMAGHLTDFTLKYGEVLNACSEMSKVIDLPPRQLARMYMSSVRSKQTNAAWWRENAYYLTEPWFIYEYACDDGLIERRRFSAEQTERLFIIEPEKRNYDGCVRVHAERKIGEPECGRITLEYAQADDSFHEFVRTLKFGYAQDQCSRIIDETGGGILNRVVETALVLLKQGYCVCVSEALLRDRILAEEYVPEHRYWVVEGSSVEKLELRYPRDRQLHEYVYRAGGRWNGKTVEISICDAHLLDDVIRLYGFRMTEGAKARMDAWRETLEHATIYRSRKRKDAQSEPAMVDKFKEMMDRKQQRIDDLYENDE